ncbi:MAG TPA: mechanosensitive ion channel domain-containing protein [Candidatus Dormibacteraeota bacterium]|nr:mechanosensitive ion channel domain-containing protein [Candidatus Dormibacteraeota bacterium]
MRPAPRPASSIAAAWGLLLLLGVLASGVARADPPPGGDADPTPDAGVDLTKGAEEVAARLRAFTRSLSDSDVFSALEAETSVVAHLTAARWEDTERLLQGHLRPTALDSLESSWEAFRSDLDNVSRRVEARATQRDADLATLTSLHASWSRALDLARSADAPPELLDRAQGDLAMIDTVRGAVEQRRAKLLVLQDATSRAMQTCDDALARIQDVRGAAIERVITPQQPALWGDGPSLRPELRAGFSLASAAAIEWANIGTYATTYRAGLVLSGLAVLVLVVLLRQARSLAAGGRGHGVSFESAASVLQTPFASAILLGLLVSRPLRPNPPFAFQQMMLAVVAAAAVFVLRPLVGARLSRLIYAFTALLFLNLASSLVEIPPRVEQLLLVAEMTVTTLLLLWGSAQLAIERPSASDSLWVWKAARTFAHVVAFGCGAAALAALLGYLDLADFLGTGLFHGLFVALGLLAIRITLDGLVTIGLEGGPLAQLHTVVRHRARIARRTRSALDVAAVLLWVWFMLGRFDLREPVSAWLAAVLDAHLRVGELDLSFSHALGFAAVVLGVVVATRVVGTLLEEDVYSRMTLPRGVPYALSTLTRYGFLLVGFLLALATLGLDLTRITVLVSALGLGLGFGLQEVMSNFVSGLILLFERPVQVGDSVEMGDVAGEILRIGIRSSTVRTAQGAEVIVPNSKLIAERVTNWTLSDRRRRIDLEVGVKGDVDAEQIIALVNDIVRRDGRVADVPPPEALMIRFGEDSMDFQVRFWTDQRDWMRLRSDISIALQRALRTLRKADPGTAGAPAA